MSSNYYKTLKSLINITSLIFSFTSKYLILNSLENGFPKEIDVTGKFYENTEATWNDIIFVMSVKTI